MAAANRPPEHQTHYERSADWGYITSDTLFSYAEGQYYKAIFHLEQNHLKYQPCGGSHAQRDVFTQTLLAAARKQTEKTLADRDLFRHRSGKPTGALSKPL